MPTNGETQSGIGRRRGAAAGSKSWPTSLLVVGGSCCLVLVVAALCGGVGFASAPTPRRNHAADLATVVDRAEAVDSSKVGAKEDALLATILRGEVHLVDIDTHGMFANKDSTRKSSTGATYHGVKASFCKLDWDRYKSDPPSLPMFTRLVEVSGCDKPKNIMTVDLATIVHQARAADPRSAAVRALPPAGFVFHESRVGSTLVANALTAMAPAGHRVYSEAHPLNNALKACNDLSSTCDRATNAEVVRDVVYLMGRTAAPQEEHLFFKVSSVGSKRIEVMQAAFPAVPWIFVFRDPVQTMMSHLDPAKMGKRKVRGGFPQAVCLRAKQHPPEDLRALARDHEQDIDHLSYEEFCAAHLATLCWSAVRGMRDSGGKGIAVEYEGLVEKLIQTVIPSHFGIPVDDAARQRILNVSKVYSKSKADARDWVEDSSKKETGATPEIRGASETFLLDSYSELKKHTMK